MKNKGFTVVELMATFVLVSIISTLLIKLTISLKQLYLNGDSKTILLTKEGIITDKIKNDLDDYNVNSISTCSTNCINFEYTINNNVVSKQLIVNKNNKTITYDNYSIKLAKGNIIEDIVFSNDAYDIGNIVNIKIPIKNKLLKEEFGINIIHQMY